MNPENIKEALLSLGYKLNDRGSYWQTSAVFRNGDNQSALQIYKDKGVWKDYVAETPWSPFVKLVQMTLGTNDPEEVSKYVSKTDSDLLNMKKLTAPKLEFEETYPISCLDRLLPHYIFYEKKGISLENLKPLRGGLASTGQLNKRFVFPIFNEVGMIHGFSGRDVTSNQNENRPKWKHLGKKKNWLYPIYTDKKTISSIEESGFVIIVESIGDMLNLRENGYYNCIVSFGLDISSKLSSFLVSIACKHIFICFNNDNSSKENRGKDASFKNYLKLLGLFSPERVKICLPTKNDFGEMNKEDFITWKAKLDKITSTDQTPIIRESCKQLLKSKKISANLGKKIKLIP